MTKWFIDMDKFTADAGRMGIMKAFDAYGVTDKEQMDALHAEVLRRRGERVERLLVPVRELQDRLRAKGGGSDERRKRRKR